MKKLTLLLFSCLFIITAVHSQQNKYHFILPLPEKKLSKSLYSNVEIIDSRYDTTNMGKMWFGIVNDNIDQPPAPSASQQLKDFVKAAVDGNVNKGDLLIQIRFFKFTDIIEKYNHSGFCFFRAGFYTKTNDGYRKISTIDTTLQFMVTSVNSTPQKFFRQCSEGITEVLTENLKRPASGDNIYSLYDIVHIDSIEKSRIPVYNTTEYKDGIYKKYSSFKDQIPDHKIVSVDTTKDGDIDEIKGLTAKGKEIKVKKQDTYALIYKNTIYLSTKYGYIPVVKVDNDFFLEGDMSTTGYMSAGRQTARAILAGFSFGATGALLSTLENKQGFKKKFEMKIDHIDGLPIKMKEIETEAEKKAKLKKEIKKTAPVKETEAPQEIKKEENKTEPQELQPY